MKKHHGFALLEVLLAVILIAIVTIGSYALVKSFRSASSVQQLTRYSTTIAQNYMPFLDGSASSDVMNGDKLSREFLQSIHIPSDDLTPGSCKDCYVNSGLYIQGGTTEIAMKFGVTTGTPPFFYITLDSVTLDQKDQIVQSLGSVFSLYCPTKRCVLGQDSSFAGTIKMVFPKAEGSFT